MVSQDRIIRHEGQHGRKTTRGSTTLAVLSFGRVFLRRDMDL